MPRTFPRLLTLSTSKAWFSQRKPDRFPAARAVLQGTVMIRITLDPSQDAIARLVVEGQIAERFADELRSVCGSHSAGRMLLDLAGVTFVDAAGAQVLRDLERQGVLLTGRSAFIEELLREAPAAAPTAPCAEEETLVARLKAGDEDAFAVLVRRHGGRMLSAARRLLRQEEEARDAVQEAFLSAFSAIDRFDGRARLSTWLHRVVVNCALMRLRRQRRRPEQPIEELLPRFAEDGHWEAGMPRTAGTSDALLERRETRDMVRACIAQLPETYRTVVVLRDIEELDTQEVADLLGVTTNTVKVRLHRGRQALRTLVERALGRPDCADRACPDRSAVA